MVDGEERRVTLSRDRVCFPRSHHLGLSGFVPKGSHGSFFSSSDLSLRTCIIQVK